MSDDLNIGMAAGIGAAQAAAQSQATHAATMAAKDGQRHQLERMIERKRWQSYAAWLKIGVKSHLIEKKVVIAELARIDPANDVAKKASDEFYSTNAYNQISSDPVEVEKAMQFVAKEIDKVIV